MTQTREQRNARRRAWRRGERIRRPYVRKAPLPLPRDPSEIFWSKVDKTGECWLWLGKLDKDGYGQFAVTVAGTNTQRHVRAHRFAYESAFGSCGAPVLRHACDNPRCVRPDHLVPGTQRENRADAVARGREPWGELKPNATLSIDAVETAKSMIASGMTVAHAARALGVRYRTLWQAVRGKTWRRIA